MIIVIVSMWIGFVQSQNATDTASATSDNSKSNSADVSSPVVVVQSPSQNNVRGCTHDDYGSTYTACEKLSDIRTVIYFKKNNCSEGVPIPTSSETLSCGMFLILRT